MDVTLTIIFNSNDGYTMKLEGYPIDVDSQINRMDCSKPLSKLLHALLKNAQKECNNGG